MVYVNGWRGKIGVITPSSGTAAETDFHENVPEGVAVLTARVSFEAVTLEGLSEMGSYVEDASALLSQALPDIIAFACTTGSLVGGVGYDKKIIDSIERRTGIPAITTSTAIVEAMNLLGIKKMAIATPYSDEVNQAEKTFLEDSGFEVASIKGLGLLGPTEMPQVRYQQMYRLVKEVFSDDVDGIFVSCTGISVFNIIQMLEEDFKRPVITSNQATLWASLRKINIGTKIEGLGRLFEL